MGSEMGRVFEFSSKFPNLRLGEPSSVFHAFANLFKEYEWFIRFLITDIVTGLLSSRFHLISAGC